MIKNASRLWGFQDTQAESSFDPFVGLILGALASELAKVSNDINSTESRILEKLVELLTPEPLTGPFTAHAIVRAKPIELTCNIDSDYQFYLNKKAITKERSSDEKTIFFTPAGNYKLFDGRLRFLYTGNKIFEFREELYKEIVALPVVSRSNKTSEIWFGLEINEDINSIDGISICCDLRNEAFENSFYESLAKGKWTINGQPVNFIHDIANNSADQNNSLESLLNKELDIVTKVSNHIHKFYRKKFFTLSDRQFSLKKITEKEYLPQAFFETFLPDDLKNLSRNLCWIKVEFPQIIPTEVFDDLFCSINCFPVFNRHLNQFTQSSKEFINIIPLFTDEIYFDMKSVTGNSGKIFNAKFFKGTKEIENGTYIVRRGGAGRFDARNATEILHYLIELLRDESASFAILGADMIASDLRELNQIISRLENRLKESNIVKEAVTYLLLRAHPADDTLFIEFWTTNGNFANNIKSGEKLMIYEGSDLLPDSVTFITPTIGGRESMDTEQKINAYRKSLLSHGRIVTPEDIKALCFEQFGANLKKVEIKKGLKTGKSTDCGFIPTLDIHLTLSKASADADKEELEFLKKDLLIKLEEQSPNMFPFRCFFC